MTVYHQKSNTKPIDYELPPGGSESSPVKDFMSTQMGDGGDISSQLESEVEELFVPSDFQQTYHKYKTVKGVIIRDNSDQFEPLIPNFAKMSTFNNEITEVKDEESESRDLDEEETY